MCRPKARRLRYCCDRSFKCIYKSIRNGETDARSGNVINRVAKNQTISILFGSYSSLVIIMTGKHFSTRVLVQRYPLRSLSGPREPCHSFTRPCSLGTAPSRAPLRRRFHRYRGLTCAWREVPALCSRSTDI